MKNFDANHYLMRSVNLPYSASYRSLHLNIPCINAEISARQCAAFPRKLRHSKKFPGGRRLPRQRLLTAPIRG
jgi:hypothetical protein